jgi:glycosyltransferase involved in cell wall biosynthesis
MSCAEAVVVTHENFLRPNGSEAFDVAGCLRLLEVALVCGRRRLAPVSPGNRRTVVDWLAREKREWELVATDWFNVVDLELVAPTSSPRDRRGRHSRPGFEKFPPLEVMWRHFPPHAEACIILGGDGLLLEPAELPEHWDVRPFAAGAVAAFLREIDFFIYFTNPLWRDSFGRVVAEAIAAGKVVITDPATAVSFPDAVIASDGDDVDRVVADLVRAPARYLEVVARAQSLLAGFGPDAFRARVLDQLSTGGSARRALV